MYSFEIEERKTITSLFLKARSLIYILILMVNSQKRYFNLQTVFWYFYKLADIHVLLNCLG